MSGHTSGPWQVGGQFDRKTFVNAGRNCIAKCDDGDVTPPLNHAANARLIAAAPDLLGALMRLTHLVATLPPDLTEPDSAIGEARAAITKATGNNTI